MVSARKLASYTGQVISTSPLVGNISRIMTRHCIMSMLCAQHWDAEVVLDRCCIEELLFWRHLLKPVIVLLTGSPVVLPILCQ